MGEIPVVAGRRGLSIPYERLFQLLGAAKLTHRFWLLQSSLNNMKTRVWSGTAPIDQVDMDAYVSNPNCWIRGMKQIFLIIEYLNHREVHSDMILIHNDIMVELALIDAERNRRNPLDPIHLPPFWKEWFPDHLAWMMDTLQVYIEKNLRQFEARWASTPPNYPLYSWVPATMVTFRAHARNMQIDLSGL